MCDVTLITDTDDEFRLRLANRAGLLLHRHVRVGIRLWPVGLPRRTASDTRLASITDRLRDDAVLRRRRGAADASASRNSCTGAADVAARGHGDPRRQRHWTEPLAGPWQLYVWDLAMSVGWAGTNVNAITTTLAYWFERRRGFALKLTLNGSSTGGFLVTPLLVHVVHRVGLANGVLLLVLAGLAILQPVILFGVKRALDHDARLSSAHAYAMASRLPAFANEAQALRSFRFRSIALPFALVLSAQVRFIVNQMALLLPHLGADGASRAIAAMAVAAVAGRSALAPVIDRLRTNAEPPPPRLPARRLGLD